MKKRIMLSMDKVLQKLRRRASPAMRDADD